MMSRKDQVVQGLTRGVAGLFRKNKIEHVRGTGRVTSPTTVEVTTTGESKNITGKRILIATGSAPVELRSIPFDGKNIVSSTEALAFASVPKKLVVVGEAQLGWNLDRSGAVSVPKCS